MTRPIGAEAGLDLALDDAPRLADGLLLATSWLGWMPDVLGAVGPDDRPLAEGDEIVLYRRVRGRRSADSWTVTAMTHEGDGLTLRLRAGDAGAPGRWSNLGFVDLEHAWTVTAEGQHCRLQLAARWRYPGRWRGRLLHRWIWSSLAGEVEEQIIGLAQWASRRDAEA